MVLIERRHCHAVQLGLPQSEDSTIAALNNKKQDYHSICLCRQIFGKLVVVSAVLLYAFINYNICTFITPMHVRMDNTGLMLQSYPLTTAPPRTRTHIVAGTNTCWRECPLGRNNKIIYTNTWRAGLNDQKSIMNDLTNLAGYLCATLEFPKPSETLSLKHNGNKAISPSLGWDDFVVIAPVEDPNVTSQQEPPLLLLHDLKEELNNIAESPKYSNERWIKVVSNNSATVANEFDLVQNISQSTITADKNTKHFVWFFELNWYHVRESLAEHFKSVKLSHPPTGPGSCFQRRNRDSPQAKKISDHLWNAFFTMDMENSRNPTIGFLHIRRTDSKNECNTTLDRIRSYLQCSFMDVSSNVTLLLGTDETDPNYITGIQHIVENELGDNHKLIHLDAWISHQLEMMAGNTTHDKAIIQRDDETGKLNATPISFLPYLNNYHLYLFGKYFSNRAAFNLEQRRNIRCHDCDPIKIKK